jgi:hypothetical protein
MFSDRLIVPLIRDGVNSNSSKLALLFARRIALRPGTTGVVFSGRKIKKDGPVAQLGARFHGMEEVKGSNPFRSTKEFKYLPFPARKRNYQSAKWRAEPAVVEGMSDVRRSSHR